MTLCKIKEYNRNILIYITLIVFIFLGRNLLFAGTYGGVEHDSGWYLGVAKNLAMRGIYASYTNTITEESPGAHVSLHGRFSVQDKVGYSYFPAGVTVGPGYVVPEAILLKIFGNGFWQYRLWPLIAFTGLLFILFFLVYKLGGLISLIIFQIWLWIVPQLYTTYAYEAYSEDIALLFFLISFLFLFFAKDKRNYFWYFLGGVFLAFSVLTKILFVLPGLAVVIFFFTDFWKIRKAFRKQVKHTILLWTVFMIGFLLPYKGFDFYRDSYLFSHFGSEGVRAVKMDYQLHFQLNGSGIDSLLKFNREFIYKKYLIWQDVAINNSLIIWLFFLSLPLLFIKFIKKNYKVLALSFYTASLVSFVWFIFFSPTGWARHAWQAIMLGMALISIGVGIIYNKYFLGAKIKRLVPALIFFAFILILIKPGSIVIKPVLGSATIEKWIINRNIRGLQGFPSNPILSLSDQKELVKYFEKDIKKEDRIYYLGWFIMAEASSLVDKVFYSLNRYFYLSQKNPDGGESYVIIGPYQQGPWSFESSDYVQNKVSELCKNIVFQNSSYLICNLKTGLSYNNPAY